MALKGKKVKKNDKKKSQEEVPRHLGKKKPKKRR